MVDEKTVTVTSSVPDPKLPTVEIYFLPKHIWEAQATPDTIETYDGLDGVGSGPFVISDYEPEASLTMVANDNYYDGRPAVDKVIFRYFSNPDAMVAALQRSEIDAAHGVPAGSMEDLDADPDIVTISGIQGGFDENALNLGAAEGQPNPAILDIEFRRALNHAIDKAGATEDLWFGLADPATTISVGADLKWVPDIPADEQLEYDPELAKKILDGAGYIDTDGDGFRETPGWRRQHRVAARRQYRLRPRWCGRRAVQRLDERRRHRRVARLLRSGPAVRRDCRRNLRQLLDWAWSPTSTPT